jgi:hypothetical protein
MTLTPVREDPRHTFFYYAQQSAGAVGARSRRPEMKRNTSLTARFINTAMHRPQE